MMAWDDEPDENLTDDYVPEQHGGRMSAQNSQFQIASHQYWLKYRPSG